MLLNMTEKTLKKLGVSRSHIGYDYLLDIFECVFSESKYDINLQCVYLQIAYERGKDWKSIRRAVRMVIDKACNRTEKPAFWEYLFGDIDKPIDDARFINTIYRYIAC